jgi:hypothetical protein
LPTPNNPRFPGPGIFPPKALILGFRRSEERVTLPSVRHGRPLFLFGRRVI